MSRTSSTPTSSEDSAVGSMSSALTKILKDQITAPGEHNYCDHRREMLPNQNSVRDSMNLNQPSTVPNHSLNSSHLIVTTATTLSTSTTTTTTTSVNKDKNFRQPLGPSKSHQHAINSRDLVNAARQMRTNNVGLISKSVRTHLSCFDELHMQKFESNGDFFVNFVSNGINKCSPTTILRPVSILWPETYDKIVEQLGILDAFLLNTEFYQKPVEWMLKKGITSVPDCRLCKGKMILDRQENLVRWHCRRSQACSNYYMPVQRPSFFSGFENVGLRKLLFAVYYWATCTPAEDLASLNMDQKNLSALWKRIQNVCRTALEKSYPKHRLTDCLDRNASSNDGEEKRIPIDLISIKLNRVYIVCAKHPSSNLVRVGYYIPDVSLYSFGELTESWFAHGASVRTSESKFLSLTKRRSDLKLQFVDRSKILIKDGKFDRDSAFGYIITQLTHVFKDYDSTGISVESLKLMLAELQWRELYGTAPFDALTNIISHMAQYAEASDWYSEITMPVIGEESFNEPGADISRSIECNQYTWAEKYYYATVEPIDSEGNVISRKEENLNFENLPPPNARVTCHLCSRKFETFDFSIHMMHHIESNRKEYEREEYLQRSLIECKHCFKIYKREHIVTHSTLLRTFLHKIKFGCRICCIKLETRDQFIQHMRRKHFEHETPYHCPSCKYASSFQRDVFLHFSEEHRHNLIVLCTLCLRSFTVAKPETMTNAKMKELSKIVYNHLAEHYVLSKSFTCSNCCLCFIDSDKLKNHIRLHHNPCEIRPVKEVKLEPFILDRDEEEFCVKAFPAELFIANKRPNLILDKRRMRRGRRDSNGQLRGSDNSLSSSDSSEEDDVRRTRVPEVRKRTTTTNKDAGGKSLEKSDLEDDDSSEGVIHVRGLEEAKKFLVGGIPALTIPKSKLSAKSQFLTSSDRPGSLSSQKLIGYLSRMKRADGIIPNQSVILTPDGKPAKCVECRQFVTTDHFVSPICCSPCNYTTLCPRAATSHYKLKHDNDN